MKIVKKSVFFLVGVLVLLLLVGLLFLYSLTPTYSGDGQLQDLKEKVTVYYDDYGIPHIYAQEELDAFRTLGYVHAQDRLWQMELLRRIASGGLSEVFGADLIGTDKFFLSLGIADASKTLVPKLNKSDIGVQLSEAYLDGINQFISEGPTPIEFYLTGIEKTNFNLEDMYNTIGYMAFSFAMAHKTDPLLTKINKTLGPAYLKDLEIGADPNAEWIKNYNPSAMDTLQNSISAIVTKALSPLNIPLFEGSNSWVIGAEKTKNGKVIFANDPHIGFAQPSVWYEAHLETPNYSKYGYHIAGMPFPLLGHNRKLAYGMTMFENDDIDFYYEQNNPDNDNQYKYQDDYLEYQSVTKTIAVKDAEDVTFTYKKSVHGPILNGIADQVTGEKPIAMYWVYTQMENKIMDALYGISHAGNLREFKSALPNIHAPGLNIMYGDAENNIGWFATAQLYKVPDTVNTKMIFEVGEGLPLKRELLDFNQNPQAINPPEHYVYSANNQPDSIAGMLYPGYYLPENRAKRIVQLLAPKNDWDSEAARTMITDVTSSVDPLVTKNLIATIAKESLKETDVKILEILKNWDGNYTLKSTAATIYTRWIYSYLKNTFKDELGKDVFNQFIGTHFSKRLIAPLLNAPASIWWDNVETTDRTESMQEIITTSFHEAVSSLETDLGKNIEAWSWDRVHTLEHGHPIGQIESLRSFFNVGPFPVNGSREVINNMAFGYDDTGYYKTGSGPSTRRIIDFSDVENSVSILPTGQSGNPLSKHYKDQAEMFVNGKFRKMMMNKKEIENGKEILIFSPKE